MDAFEIIRERLEKRLSQSSSLVIGLSGPQGCGKSTVSAKLKEHFGAECAVLGLDDFYLAKAEREQLGQAVSPLFETRGPPGTHDIGFLTLQLDALLSPNSVLPVFVPRFDKTNDDRRPKASWFTVESRPSLIIIEGWCVGAIPSPDFCTAAPLNGAERRDPTDGGAHIAGCLFSHLRCPMLSFCGRLCRTAGHNRPVSCSRIGRIRPHLSAALRP